VATLAPSKPREAQIGGGGRRPGDISRYGGGDHNQPPEHQRPVSGYRMGMWLAIASMTMMFMALTSAYIVNQASKDSLIDVPPILWLSNVVILACSVTIELARRSLRRRTEDGLMRWLVVTAGLGLVFLVSQYLAWRYLRAEGFYISFNRHTGYAYMLTALHALHLAGGLLALVYVTMRVKFSAWTAARKRISVDATAIYWHFLAGLWIFLFVLLFFWR
jgi:cytochrome c oxidase subunit 3